MSEDLTNEGTGILDGQAGEDAVSQDMQPEELSDTDFEETGFIEGVPHASFSIPSGASDEPGPPAEGELEGDAGGDARPCGTDAPSGAAGDIGDEPPAEPVDDGGSQPDDAADRDPGQDVPPMAPDPAHDGPGEGSPSRPAIAAIVQETPSIDPFFIMFIIAGLVLLGNGLSLLLFSPMDGLMAEKTPSPAELSYVADEEHAIDAGTYHLEEFSIEDGVCKVSYSGEAMEDMPLSKVYIPRLICEEMFWQVEAQVFRKAVGEDAGASGKKGHSIIFSEHYALHPDAKSAEQEKAIIRFVPETLSSKDGKHTLDNASGYWSIDIHYWPAKSVSEEYKLISYESNEGNAGTLTYELAAGATETVSVWPSDIDVTDDHRGVAEKRWGYVEAGDDVSWENHWVVHSL